MAQASSPLSLEQYLIESGMLSRQELSLAKKLQQQQRGPLLMVLLRLDFINLEQLSGLWDAEATAWV